MKILLLVFTANFIAVHLILGDVEFTRSIDPTKVLDSVDLTGSNADFFSGSGRATGRSLAASIC